MITLIPLNDAVINIYAWFHKVSSHLALLYYAYGSSTATPQQNERFQ